MIEYFRTDEATKSLVRIDAEQPGCWIALFGPTDAELSETAERFSIDLDDMQAPLDLDEVSRIEHNDRYTMFIVDTPMKDPSASSEERRYTTIPVGIFETAEHVISVCTAHRVPIIALLKSRTRVLHDTGLIKEFTSDVLMASSDAYFASLQALNRRRKELSATTRPSRADLEELYALDASLVYIRTSLATNDTIFERYRRYALSSYDERTLDLFDDVVIENRQALETANIYSEILDSTIDHFGLLMDYDLNRTMQLVAAFTLVLCVPTVVGGLFGMNLEGIPLSGHPHGFAIITGITAAVFAAVLLLLKRLKWF